VRLVAAVEGGSVLASVHVTRSGEEKTRQSLLTKPRLAALKSWVEYR
jgi:hypothetical protein